MVLRATNEIFSSVLSPKGSNMKDVFERQDNKDGSCELVKVGETDIQEKINSFKEQTDYVTLLEKMEAGDPVATVRAQAAIQPRSDLVFGDDSAEQSLRSILDAQITAKRLFDSFGGEKKLGMSFNDFLNRGEVQMILESAPKKVINADPVAAEAAEGAQNEQE